MRPSRRALLLGGGAVGLLVAGGGVGLFLRPSAAPPVDLPVGACFSADELAILYALASGLLPTAGPDLRVETVMAVDGVVSRMHQGDQAELKQALVLFENALVAFVLGGRTQTFSSLDPAAADQALAKFQRNGLAPVRTAFRALRGLLCAAWGANPKLDPLTGYGGPPDFNQACAPDPWTQIPGCPGEVTP